MIAQHLERLGFSPSETKVYLHLLNHGASNASTISRETGLNRTNVYEALDRLLQKGVVSQITKNKVRCVEAESPDELLSLLDQEQTDLQLVRKNLKREVNHLKKTIHKNTPKLEANIFVGKKGLRILFEEILEKTKPIYLIAAELQLKKTFGPYFELWHRKRIERKIPQKSIFPRSYANKLKPRKYLQYLFVDNKFTNPTTTIIYGTTTLFIHWSHEPVLAIKIENRQITRSHRNYFDMMWNSVQ